MLVAGLGILEFPKVFSAKKVASMLNPTYQTLIDQGIINGIRIVQLLDITAKINSGLEFNEILNHIVVGALRVMEAEKAAIWLYDHDKYELVSNFVEFGDERMRKGERIGKSSDAIWKVFNEKIPFLLDINQGNENDARLIVPLLTSDEEAIGAFEVKGKEQGHFEYETDVPFFSSMANQVAMVIERERIHANALASERKARKAERLLEAERRIKEAELAQSFAQGVEVERSRLARDLHDQVLGSISGLMRSLRMHIRKENGVEIRYLRENLEALERISGEIREIMEDLKPSTLDHFGLESGLEVLIKRAIQDSGREIDFQNEIETVSLPQFSEFECITIYRIIQEALSNSLKYANCTKLSLSIKTYQKGWCICFSDNGSGFEFSPNQLDQAIIEGTGGNGLKNMLHRAKMIGADLSWKQGKQGGTVVELKGYSATDQGF